MLYGLQTHFGAPLPDDVLPEVANRRIDLCRIDAQQSPVYIMRQMVEQTIGAGLIPYVTVASYEHIEALPPGTMCEWRNEPDISTSLYVAPDQYAREFSEACFVAGRSAVGQIGGPVTSNLNKRGVDYNLAVLNALGGSLPSNAFAVTHRYGHNSFSTSHRLSKWWPWGDFKSREAELEWFITKVARGGLWGVSEFGWPSADDVSEEKQARLVTNEWQLYAKMGAYFAVDYQLNDGSGWGGIDHFGWRRFDGSWKPVSETVPIH